MNSCVLLNAMEYTTPTSNVQSSVTSLNPCIWCISEDITQQKEQANATHFQHGIDGVGGGDVLAA